MTEYRTEFDSEQVLPVEILIYTPKVRKLFIIEPAVSGGSCRLYADKITASIAQTPMDSGITTRPGCRGSRLATDPPKCRGRCGSAAVYRGSERSGSRPHLNVSKLGHAASSTDMLVCGERKEGRRAKKTKENPKRIQSSPPLARKRVSERAPGVEWA